MEQSIKRTKRNNAWETGHKTEVGRHDQVDHPNYSKSEVVCTFMKTITPFHGPGTKLGQHGACLSQEYDCIHICVCLFFFFKYSLFSQVEKPSWKKIKLCIWGFGFLREYFLSLILIFIWILGVQFAQEVFAICTRKSFSLTTWLYALPSHVAVWFNTKM